MSAGAGSAARDAAREVLEAPIDRPGLARQTSARPAGGGGPRHQGGGGPDPVAAAMQRVARMPPPKQRGRTGAASAFDAKHPRQAKGRVGGGQFKTKGYQQTLQQQGMYKGKIDGVAGPQTEAAIRQFQAKYGLPQTGKLDERTRLTLESPPPKSEAQVRKEREQTVNPPKASASSSRSGTSSTAKTGTGGSSSTSTPSSGSKLDVHNEHDVKQFQRQHGLKVDGMVGPETKGAMEALGVNQPNRSQASSRSRSSSSGSRSNRSSSRSSSGLVRQGAGMNLKRGDKGVRQLQTALQDLGYDLGGAGTDGKFGPVTAKAVKAFQREHGLAPDGVIGRHTRRLLDMLASKSRSARGKQNAPLSIDQEQIKESYVGLLAAARAEQLLAAR